MNAEELAKQLRGVGPVIAEKLINVGINTPEKLAEMGAEEAFVLLFEKGEFCETPHAAYLYSLYGATHDIDWRDVPEEKKKEFKNFTKSMKASL